MKKTTTINLAGMVFHIEEEGYLLLKKYFDDLRRIFSKQDGVDEMILDIESRFAELFQERLNEFKEVVTETDVSEVISIMGSPNQYDDNLEGDDTDYEEDFTDTSSGKKLFRDTDEAVIGGVAAGLAHFFGLTPILVRVFWILFSLLGGSGILVYIVAWIVIPEAKTTSQKLQMHGQTPNLDNIKSYVDKAADEAKKGYNRAIKSAERSFKDSNSIVNKTANAFSKFFGGLLIFIGVIGLTGIGVAFFLNYSQISINNAVINTDVDSLVGLFFINEKLSFWLLLVISTIPIMFLITTGAKLLFNQKLKVKALNWSLFFIWVGAIAGLVIVSFKSGLDFKEKYVVEESIFIEDNIKQLSVHLFEDDIEITNSMSYDFDNYISISDKMIKLGYINIEVEPTKDTLFYYTITKSSKGGTLKSSKDNAENILLDIELNENKININTRYQFPKAKRFRDQKATLKIFVPEGQRIILNGNLKEYPLKIKSVDKFVKRDLKQTTVWEATDRGMELLD